MKIISLESEYEYEKLKKEDKLDSDTIYFIKSPEIVPEKDVVVVERSVRRLYSVFEILAIIGLNFGLSYIFVQIFK